MAPTEASQALRRVVHVQGDFGGMRQGSVPPVVRSPFHSLCFPAHFPHYLDFFLLCCGAFGDKSGSTLADTRTLGRVRGLPPSKHPRPGEFIHAKRSQTGHDQAACYSLQQLLFDTFSALEYPAGMYVNIGFNVDPSSQRKIAEKSTIRANEACLLPGYAVTSRDL
ncbi:hypothetical protein CIHG_06723 [Coccidioides immitis H538.4]|uniref:Uncharacterized protein n=2 Tax=Coccidioides immitis TaxID=5501 RepID=A0A0J8RWG2_COCIT|nr:hypothetical protein CIRG_01616 [Coccidioides immitis RMSCC 2394]KMU88921.1 hypothetical protein CIHG_06723 [Coccidioides immitis H538.4]